MAPDQLSTLAQFEQAANERLSPMAAAYYAGGARDEITLRSNHEAWRQLWLHYKVLVDVANRSTETQVLGQTCSSRPVSGGEWLSL